MWFIKIKKAFSLSELLVVIMILGILAGVAMPKFKRVLDSRKTEEAENMLKAARIEQELRCMSGKNYLGEGNLGKLETLANASQSKNYVYSLQPTGISAAAIGSDYTLKMISYKTGTICCEGDGCSALNKNYLLCNSLEPVQDECAFDSAYGGPSGWQSCDTYPCTKSCTRDVRAGYTCTGTYNEDNTYNELVCQGDICTSIDYTAEDKKTRRDTCIMSGDVCNVKKLKIYDENGNMLRERTCSANNELGVCTSYSNGYDYVYDSDNHMISKRFCTGSSYFKTDGTCRRPASIYDYIYDSNGNKTADRSCSGSNAQTNGTCSSYTSGYDYAYDSKGNKVAYWYCSENSIPAEGSCSSYTRRYDYTYDDNGNEISLRDCSSSTLNSNGTCNSYFSGRDRIYDKNGNLIADMSCSSIGSNNSCRYPSRTDYKYDENGKETTRRGCVSSKTRSDGTCTSYNYGYDFTYDNNGNQTSYRYCKGSDIQANGSCSSYSGSDNYDFTYDEFGNQTSERRCSGMDSEGNCVGFNYGKDYRYDELGNKIATRSCSSWSDFECTSWGDWTYFD